jgi:ornithine cyclodeaminase/alanine dehydrogenase-like protein (mu-crystallin family)
MHLSSERMRFIDATEFGRLLPIVSAIDALETAFAGGVPETPLRQRSETSDGELMLMPAWSDLGVGVKLVTITPSNPVRSLPLIHGAYVLFEPGTQRPEAIIDGAALTALRTAAVSGLATRHLARPDASRLLVFGSGVQARSHVQAMRAVRAIDEVIVVGRDHQRAQAFAAEAGGRPGEPGEVGSADIVCTCTTSPTPLFDGSQLPPGAHVNAVGAHTPTTRELDSVAIARSRVVVETREVAMAEAGDLLIAIAEGEVDEHHAAADLGELVSGTRVRTSESDITVFKSVGMAFEDLVAARAAVDRLPG